MKNFSRRFTKTIAQFAALLIIVGALAMNVQPVVAAANAQSSAESTLLVHFDAGVTAETRDAVIAQMGGQLVTWMEQIHVAEIRVAAQEGVMVASLPAVDTGIVTYAEADMVVSGDAIPNDPDFSDEMMSYGLNDVQALDAWDIITGSQDVVIAVVDSGIKLDHPEFADRLVPGYDFINDDDQADDEAGHGTHVAGIIAAAMNNGQGVAGVCPNCRLMPVKVLNANNLGSWSQLAQGILFAVDNGARVINLSLGAASPSQTLAAAIDYAVQNGVVVIAAAGNFGSDAPFYPAALEGVIAVSATTSNGERWSKSNFGSFVDLAAPGAMVYSTYNDLNNIYHGYTYMSGTSMATPFVSGIAGLLLSADSSLTVAEVTDALISGAEDLGSQGWDAEFGYGRVSALGALMSPVVNLADSTGDNTTPLNPSQSVMLFLPALNKN